MTPESTPLVIPSNKPILVTGAAGFIGFQTARRLLDEGHRVVGLDNLNPCYDPQLKADRLALLEGCRHHGVGHLLSASTSSACGLNAQVPEPNDAWDAEHPDPATSRAPWRVLNTGSGGRVGKAPGAPVLPLQFA